MMTNQKDMYDIFWCKASGKYQLISNEVRAWVLFFPTSYLVEKEFSAMTQLLSKQKNCLFISKRNELRLYQTKMSPNMKMLVKDHRAHSFH